MTGDVSVAACLAIALTSVAIACAPVQQYQEPPAASYSPKRFTLEGDGASAVVDGADVSAEFFAAAQAKPLLGRLFIDLEYAGTATTPVAVVSHQCWEERFGSAPSLIGRVLNLDGRPRTVVGVLPRGFDVPKGSCVWLPRVSVVIGFRDREQWLAHAAGAADIRRRSSDVLRNAYGADVLISKKQLAIDAEAFVALLQRRTPGLAAPEAAHGT